MLSIINQIKTCTDLEELKKLFKQFCQTCGEAPDDAGLMDAEDFTNDEKMKKWIYDKHPENTESFEERISNGQYNGAYLYALCSEDVDGEDWEDELIHFIALYYIDNTEAFNEFVENLEQQWEE